MDLFVVPTIGFKLLYAFVIVRLDRRDLVWINVTAHPTAEWVARQIAEAFPWNEAPRYMIRDRDCIYGTAVTRRLRAMGIRDKPIAPASPWQNGFVERLIGSIRRECVDHIIVLGQAHLRGILKSYARYYNETRTHLALDKDAPVSRPVQRTGVVRSRAILGGLHHHYARAYFGTHRSIVPGSPDEPVRLVGPLGRLGFPGHILSVPYTQAETLHFLQNKSMSSAPSTILNPAGTLSGLVRRSPRINA